MAPSPARGSAGRAWSIDLSGRRFGRLTVLEPARRRGSQGKLLWLARCDCGWEGIVFGFALRNGNTRSCGCRAREIAADRAVARRRNEAGRFVAEAA